MGSANGGDIARVAGSGKPVPHSRPYPAPRDRWLSLRGLAGDQQDHPNALRNGAIKAFVEERISRGEIMAVKIDIHFGLNKAAGKPPVPRSIKRAAWPRRRPQRRRLRAWFRTRPPRRRLYFDRRLTRYGFGFGRGRVERPDAFNDLCPKRLLVRVEAARHWRSGGRQRPWEAGYRPVPSPTCPRQSWRLHRPLPKRYRTDWRP